MVVRCGLFRWLSRRHEWHSVVLFTTGVCVRTVLVTATHRCAAAGQGKLLSYDTLVLAQQFSVRMLERFKTREVEGL